MRKRYFLRESSRKFNEFLDSGPNLRSLLAHSDVLTELWKRNKKLYGVISREFIHDLIEYMTTEPKIDEEVIFCEVSFGFFNQKINCILEFMVTDITLLNQFFFFLGKDECLNPVLSGYFAQVFRDLHGKYSQIILNFTFFNEYHTLIIENLMSSSMIEVAFLCLAGSNSKMSYMRERLDMLEGIVDGLYRESIYAANCKTIIVRMIQEKYQVHSYYCLLEYLIMEINIDRISCALAETASKVSEILAALVVSNHFKDELEKVVIQNFPLFVRILRKEKNLVGEDRLNVIRMINVLIDYTEKVNFTIVEFGTIDIITKLFFKFEWNSILHNLYLQLVETIIESMTLPLIKQLISCEFIENLILMNTKETRFNEKLFRKGNIAQAYRIAALILAKSKNSQFIEALLPQSKDWQVFTQTLYLQISIESTSLPSNAKSSAESSSMT